jgi:hypothetical protein
MKIIPAVVAGAVVLFGLSAYFHHTGIISGRSILVSGNIEAADVRVSFRQRKIKKCRLYALWKII